MLKTHNCIYNSIHPQTLYQIIRFTSDYYYPSYRVWIIITKYQKKLPLNFELSCSTTYTLILFQFFIIAILAQPLLCQATQIFLPLFKQNIAFNVAYSIVILKIANLGYVWVYSHLNPSIIINYYLLYWKTVYIYQFLVYLTFCPWLLLFFKFLINDRFSNFSNNLFLLADIPTLYFFNSYIFLTT